MSIDNKIKELGFELPNAADPVGSYVAAKMARKLLYISGQISIIKMANLLKENWKRFNNRRWIQSCRKVCTKYCFTSKKACENDLSAIKECVKLTGFVNSTDDFTDQPKVINGASDIIAKIFSEKECILEPP